VSLPARKPLRTFLGVLLVVVLSLGLTACGPAPKPQATTPPGQTQPAPIPAPGPTTPPTTTPSSTVFGKMAVRFLDVG
jgi:hypothetical protein